MMIYKLDLVSISHYLVSMFYITAIATGDESVFIEVDAKFIEDEFLFFIVDSSRLLSTVHYISLSR